jgi:hypothetical protein
VQASTALLAHAKPERPVAPPEHEWVPEAEPSEEPYAAEGSMAARIVLSIKEDAMEEPGARVLPEHLPSLPAELP